MERKAHLIITIWVNFINDVGNHQDFYRPFHINIKYGFSIIFNSQKLSHFGPMGKKCQKDNKNVKKLRVDNGKSRPKLFCLKCFQEIKEKDQSIM